MWVLTLNKTIIKIVLNKLKSYFAQKNLKIETKKKMNVYEGKTNRQTFWIKYSDSASKTYLFSSGWNILYT